MASTNCKTWEKRLRDSCRACNDRQVRVGTPLGEFPFEYRRVECRQDAIVIVGIVAGFEMRVVLGKNDARRAALMLALPAAAASALLLSRPRRV
jgi:hypothetical protein